MLLIFIMIEIRQWTKLDIFKKTNLLTTKDQMILWLIVLRLNIGERGGRGG